MKAETRLRSILEDLTAACLRYQTVTKTNSMSPGSGKTKLDKERIKLCLREIVSLIWRVFRKLNFFYFPIKGESG